jgi:hypothetical protein
MGGTILLLLLLLLAVVEAAVILVLVLVEVAEAWRGCCDEKYDVVSTRQGK